MKYCLFICLLVVGLAGCMSSGGKNLEAIGSQACKTATACCRSIHLAKTNPAAAETSSTEAYTGGSAVSTSLLEWNIDIFTR